MCTRAKSTPGVGRICGCMHVRYLDRREEKQQEGATKSNGDPPGTSRVISGLRKEHHLQVYRVCSPWWGYAMALGTASSHRPWALRISSTTSLAVPWPPRA
jgi:hypothetical protein